jgi:membrane peptidoglycan carboxypeptidase
MASAFGTLANQGVHCEPYAVARVEAPDEDGSGVHNLYRHRRQCEKAITSDIANLITAMLQRVVTGGTGTAASIGRPVAGKTGTAQDYTNVYFAGYTPQVSTAVWVGHPSGQIAMNGYFGGTVAAPIWHDFMVRAMQGYRVEGFPAPPPPERGQVPDVVGLRSGEAQAILVEANFTPIVEKVGSFEATNTVLSQAPGGGASAVLGSAVTIQISDGKGEPVIVPHLTGLREDDAVKKLERLELIASITYVGVNDPHLDGIVLAQTPIGDGSKEVDVGATVELQVGRFQDGNGNGNGNGSRALLRRRA